MFWKRLSLTGKIFAAIALTATLIVVVMAVLVGLNMKAGFARYVVQAEINRFDDLEQALAEAHDSQIPGWPELVSSRKAWREFIRDNFRPKRARRANKQRADNERPKQRGNKRPRPEDPLRLNARISLLDANGDFLIGTANGGPHFVTRAIVAENQPDGSTPIGWIGLAAPSGAAGAADAVFLWEQLKSLVLVSLVALALSAFAAFVLARQFLAPVKALEHGARALAAGNYDSRMTHDRHDELGSLIDHYNVLAKSLEAAENAERQWITDTSHELQTPLAVLRAEIEALQDGVRKPTETVLAGLHASVMRLSHLVGDLNTLSRTREGGFSLALSEVDLSDIIDEAAELAGPGFTDAELTFRETHAGPLVIECDRHRIRQLLDNLLENSRRYTSSPGSIVLTAHSDETEVFLRIEDTAPCPPVEKIEHIFERFYRAEASRSRAHGGSGLGLAICQAIVKAHAGRIEASASTMGGLRIDVALPRISPKKIT